MSVIYFTIYIFYNLYFYFTTFLKKIMYFLLHTFSLTTQKYSLHWECSGRIAIWSVYAPINHPYCLWPGRLTKHRYWVCKCECGSVPLSVCKKIELSKIMASGLLNIRNVMCSIYSYSRSIVLVTWVIFYEGIFTFTQVWRFSSFSTTVVLCLFMFYEGNTHIPLHVLWR